MLFKTYDQNDKSLTERIVVAGLSDYKAQKLIVIANEKKVNIQKAYLLTDASVIKVDIVLVFIMSFFLFAIFKVDCKELWAFCFIFGLLFFVLELTCRFHKDYLKLWKVFLKLRGI